MKDIYKIIENGLRSRNDPPRHYIGASMIGNPCKRYIYNSFHMLDGDGYKLTTLLTFEIGHKIEEIILSFFKTSNYQIETQVSVYEKTNEKFKGNIDAIITDSKGCRYILEVKSAKSSEFQKLERTGLKEWRAQYIAQAQSYMGMSGIKQTIFIVVNKDTSNIYIETVDFDPFAYDELKIKALMILNMDMAPEKIAQSPSFYVCKMCKYHTLCHRPA